MNADSTAADPGPDSPADATAGQPVKRPPRKKLPAAAQPATEAPTVEAPVVAPEASEQTPPVTAPRRSRRRRILLIVLGGVVVLIIAGLGIAYGVLSARYAPGASVSAFLDQVVKGRSAEAIKLMSPKPEGNPGLMNDDVYAATKHRVTSYRIESTEVHGDHAQVTAQLHTDSGSWTQRFDLVGSHHVLLWNEWTVDGTALPKVTLDDDRPSGVNVTANDIVIQKDSSAFDEFYVLPGTYAFAIESDNSLVAADSHSVAIHSMSGSRNVKVQLRFRLTDDGIAAGRAAIDQFLDACLAQPTLAPTGDCGFYVENDPTGTISNILWSITRRPDVSFGDWEDNGWTVKTDTAGVFEMDGIYSGSLGRGDVSALFTSYDVQGYVDLEDGKIAFHSTYADGAGGEPGSGSV